MSSHSGILAAEQRLVEGVQRGQVLYVGDPLVHGSGEVVPMVEAAQDDAREVNRLHEDAEQGALDAHHVPPVGRGTQASAGYGAGRRPDAHLPVCTGAVNSAQVSAA